MANHNMPHAVAEWLACLTAIWKVSRSNTTSAERKTHGVKYLAALKPRGDIIRSPKPIIWHIFFEKSGSLLAVLLEMN